MMEERKMEGRTPGIVLLALASARWSPHSACWPPSVGLGALASGHQPPVCGYQLIGVGLWALAATMWASASTVGLCGRRPLWAPASMGVNLCIGV